MIPDPASGPVCPLLVANELSGPLWGRKKLSSLIASFSRRFPGGRVVTVSSFLRGEHSPDKLLNEGPDLLVVYGGDGTVNRMVQYAIPSGLPILVLPGGTGNLLARYLHTPEMLSSRDSCWSLLHEARIFTIRPGTIGKHLFLVMAGIGWDATAAKRLLAKGHLGAVSYYEAGLRTLLSTPLRPFRIALTTVDNKRKIYENVRWCLIGRIAPVVGPFHFRARESADSHSLTVLLSCGHRINILKTCMSFLPGAGRVLPLTGDSATHIDILEEPESLLTRRPDIHADGEDVQYSSRVGVSSRTLSFLSFPKGGKSITSDGMYKNVNILRQLDPEKLEPDGSLF